MTKPTLTPPTSPEDAAAFDLLTPDQQEIWSERAAILEYDGGLTRTQAEDKAWEAIR